MTNLRLPKVKISVPFVIMLAILYVGDLQNIFWPTLLAVVIHELGHIAAIKICRGTIEEIDIKIFGARIIVPELKLMPYKSEIIIAAAGPAAGLLTVACSLVAENLFGIRISEYFVGINLVISMINMIPVYPLDGGRIMLSAFLLLFSMRWSKILYRVISILASVACCALCVALSAYGKVNPTVIIFTAYVFICSITLRPWI